MSQNSTMKVIILLLLCGAAWSGPGDMCSRFQERQLCRGILPEEDRPAMMVVPEVEEELDLFCKARGTVADCVRDRTEDCNNIRDDNDFTKEILQFNSNLCNKDEPFRGEFLTHMPCIMETLRGVLKACEVEFTEDMCEDIEKEKTCREFYITHECGQNATEVFKQLYWARWPKMTSLRGELW